MKKAIEESQKLEDMKKEEENEEDEMIRKAIEASMVDAAEQEKKVEIQKMDTFMSKQASIMNEIP